MRYDPLLISRHCCSASVREILIIHGIRMLEPRRRVSHDMPCSPMVNQQHTKKRRQHTKKQIYLCCDVWGTKVSHLGYAISEVILYDANRSTTSVVPPLFGESLGSFIDFHLFSTSFHWRSIVFFFFCNCFLWFSCVLHSFPLVFIGFLLVFVCFPIVFICSLGFAI